MGNSKRIGSNYEREIARVLSKWISGKEDPLICWRNVHSGTVSTVDKKKGLSGLNTEGDFQCLDLNYQYMFDLFCFDSKSYKECNPYFINEKNQKSNAILNQWIKVCRESENKIPTMLCKIRDRTTPEFIMFPRYIKLPINIHKMEYSFYDENILDCCILMMDKFFNSVHSFDLYELNKNRR